MGGVLRSPRARSARCIVGVVSPSVNRGRASLVDRVDDADTASIVARELVEGSMTIDAAGERYVAKFWVHAGVETRASEPVTFWTREAVARFLQEIGIRPADIITIMDDLRDTGTAWLPSVLLTRTQAATFQV